MTRRVALSALTGLLVMVVLVELHGIGPVFEAMGTARWGMPFVIVLHGISIGCAGLAWCVLSCGWRCERGPVFVLARWIREGVNDLLPVAQIGGHLVGARMLTFSGIESGSAGGSVVVDVTMRLVAQLVFTLLGLAYLAWLGVDGVTLGWIGGGIALGTLGLVGFVLAQRWGMVALIERGLAIVARRWKLPFFEQAPSLQTSIEALYQRPGRMAGCLVLHGVALIVQACEIWVMLVAMDAPVSLSQALLVESLALAIKSLAFSIPAGLGVQEGGYVLVGALVGLPPPLMLAVSLSKRMRDVMLGVPALMVWRAWEGGWAWSRVANKESSRGLPGAPGG